MHKKYLSGYVRHWHYSIFFFFYFLGVGGVLGLAGGAGYSVFIFDTNSFWDPSLLIVLYSKLCYNGQCYKECRLKSAYPSTWSSQIQFLRYHIALAEEQKHQWNLEERLRTIAGCLNSPVKIYESPDHFMLKSGPDRYGFEML